jgi:hypothetical protein
LCHSTSLNEEENIVEQIIGITEVGKQDLAWSACVDDRDPRDHELLFKSFVILANGSRALSVKA